MHCLIDINETMKIRYQSQEQKITIKSIEKLYESRKKELSNCLMIILKLLLRLNIDQFMDRDVHVC